MSVTCTLMWFGSRSFSTLVVSIRQNCLQWIRHTSSNLPRLQEKNVVSFLRVNQTFNMTANTASIWVVKIKIISILTTCLLQISSKSWQLYFFIISNSFFVKIITQCLYVEKNISSFIKISYVQYSFTKVPTLFYFVYLK